MIILDIVFCLKCHFSKMLTLLFYLSFRYIQENYIRVSRQVGGAKSNVLGQLAQKYVTKHLAFFLPSDWNIAPESSLPNVSHTSDSKETNFDIVVRCIRKLYIRLSYDSPVAKKRKVTASFSSADIGSRIRVSSFEIFGLISSSIS